MARRLFGTDGVRGVANRDLTAGLAMDLSVAAARVLGEAGVFKGHRPVAVVGRDPRASGEFLEAAVAAGLAGAGVDVLRLDAAPFLWKRLGTDCQNQPEVHDLLQAFRAAVRIAAPAMAFKAEAIVAPRELVPYLDECDLAYHNVLMVLLWSTLATGKVALMTSVLRGMPLFDYLGSERELGGIFDEAMTSVSELSIASVIAAGTASKTIAKQPTDCRARASSQSWIALLAVLPWAL